MLSVTQPDGKVIHNRGKVPVFYPTYSVITGHRSVLYHKCVTLVELDQLVDVDAVVAPYEGFDFILPSNESMHRGLLHHLVLSDCIVVIVPIIIVKIRLVNRWMYASFSEM